MRPQIAEHPNAYPGLLDWLGGLGDPDVDAALASRSGPGEDQPTQALPTGSSNPQQTEEFGAVHHGQWHPTAPRPGRTRPPPTRPSSTRRSISSRATTPPLRWERPWPAPAHAATSPCSSSPA
ncbi:hypothetical protein [Nesterenkonia pannonica]|uniref:variant leucine-rich repeat-containing protein n=1 Tax=Nesterenkonia pannonica TaxID=1548602 RepID=UPI002164BA70|nr:hypothetical protein [Nesterenkonia pannonica]